MPDATDVKPQRTINQGGLKWLAPIPLQCGLMELFNRDGIGALRTSGMLEYAKHLESIGYRVMRSQQKPDVK